jgi:hypothetical protein
MRLYGPHLNPVMRTRLIAAVAIIGALYCLPAPASAQPPLGSRSFLSRHVSSVAELRRELDRDPSGSTPNCFTGRRRRSSQSSHVCGW